jgi:hypothetical protein
MTREELKTGTRLITQAICEHMPSAAVASEWMSEVSPEPFVKAMCERFPFGTRPENLGLTPLTEWLKEQGVEAGKAFVMAVRKVWIMDAMRAECAKGSSVATFEDKR